ncbi:uncharacterized protein [Chelonus insularis]|uniref:uncharacterized protein n=1 Tax=Chelonus insularis TaxID=460826 RepID=UPI00158A45F3|nr:uncharacterized protein LOC118071003 [Chelonus insularis]
MTIRFLREYISLPQPLNIKFSSSYSTINEPISLIRNKLKMNLIFFTLLFWYPMINSLELAHVMVNNNRSIIRINDKLNERPINKPVNDEDDYSSDAIQEIEDIEDDDSETPVAIMSIDPDGRVNCRIANTL